MMADLSRTSKTVVVGAAQASAALAMLVIAAVLSRILDRGDYATYRQALLTFQVASPLLALGLPQALFYFLPREPDLERGVFREGAVLLFGVGLAVAGFFWVGGNRFVAAGFSNPDLESALLVFAPYAVFALPILAVSPCLTSKGKVVSLAGFTLVNRGLMVVAVVGLVWYYRTPVAGLWGLVGVATLMVLPAMLLCWRSCTPGTGKRGLGLREQLKYSVPLGLASAIGALTLGMDKLIVSAMLPKEEFAIYINGAIELPLIGIVSGAAAAVMMPEIAAMHRGGRKSEIIGLFGRAAKKSSLVLYPFMVLLMVLAPELMVFMYSEGYVESSVPFRIYLLLIPLRVVVYGAVLQGAGKSRVILFSSALALAVNGLLSVILVHRLGYVGAALGTVLTVGCVLVPFLLSKISGITSTPFWKVLPFIDLVKRFGLSWLCGVPLVLVLWLIGEEAGAFVRLASGSLIYGATYLLAFHLVGYIDARKGIEMAVEAYAKLRKRRSG